MFSSKKEETPMATITPTSPAPVSSAAAQPKKPAGRNGAPSIISSDLSVTGTLASAGDMQIDGSIDGDVRCANLVVGESATVKGEIVAEEVVVRGRVEGSIRAR
jgi:cytoskeletal protein CcmA (bactofilin family)